MRALVTLALLLGVMARADTPFALDAPFDDERRAVTGFLGQSAGQVQTRGLSVSGHSPASTYTQGGGELSAELGVVPFPTTLGNVFGFEGELALGAMTSELWANGELRDQRDASEAHDTARPWITFRLGARFVVSPLTVGFGLGALRVGLVAGGQLEANGARSFVMAGAFTAGAHLNLNVRGLAVQLAWLAVPPQGDPLTLVRHRFTLDVGLGPLVLSGRLQLDHFENPRPAQGTPGALDSLTFGLALGYRFAPFQL